VVIDSSDPERRARLREGLVGTPASVVPAIALGCTEPLRPFAHRQLHTPWVFSVDADELVSAPLMARIRSLDPEHNAYLVPRYERGLRTVTWHPRIYRRESLTYQGWIHETPKLEGPVGRLSLDERLDHDADYSRYLQSGGRSGSYLPIESYERPFSGPSLRREFAGEGVLRLVPHRDGPLTASRARWFVRAWQIGQWAPGAAPVRRRRHRRFFAAYLRARCRAFFELSEDDRVEAVEIADELVRSGGPIPYLGFDDLDRVVRLTQKAPIGGSGGEQMRALLVARHRQGVPAERWPPGATI